jgi:guanylate kinase
MTIGSGSGAGAARALVITGPSGVGKGTVVARLLQRRPDLWLSVSATTRRPRPGEREGEHYTFISEPEFHRLARDGQMLEYAQFAGSWYGTPAGPLREHLAQGRSVLLEIELEGARQVRDALPQAVLVFLAPPSTEELAARLAGRGTEDPVAMQLRLERAEHELAAARAGEFDHVIVNDDVERVVSALLDLIPGPSQGEP